MKVLFSFLIMILSFYSPSASWVDPDHVAQDADGSGRGFVPGYGDLDDLEARAAGFDQQFRIEKEPVRADVRQHAVAHRAADCLEAALRVLDAGLEQQPEQAAVAPREQPSLERAPRLRLPAVARADGHAPGSQSLLEQLRQGGQIGGEIDIHESVDIVAGEPPPGLADRGPLARPGDEVIEHTPA